MQRRTRKALAHLLTNQPTRLAERKSTGASAGQAVGEGRIRRVVQRFRGARRLRFFNAVKAKFAGNVDIP
jgi:hypothetical protein